MDLDGDDNSLTYTSFNDGTADGDLTINTDGGFSLNNSTNIGNGDLSINVDADNDGAETLTVGVSPTASSTVYSGSAASNDSLTGPNSNTSWTVTGTNSGTLASNNFSNFANLTGGTGDDTFTFSNSGALTGLLDGASHSSGDTADYSALGAQTIDLGGNAGGVIRIENVTGNSNQTLLGAANSQSWTINGADDGTVVDQETSASVTFTNFGNLTGAGSNDTFTFASGGSVSGLINGGGGTDTVDYDTNNISGVTVTLNGTNTGITNIENLAGQNTTLVGNAAGATVWNLNASSGGTANDGTTTVTFTNTTTIRNGATTNTFTANGSYSGTVNLTVLDNTWNHTEGGTLTKGSVTGDGALTIPDLNAGSLGINETDLDLPTMNNFTGHLIIGGSLAPAGTSPFYNAETIVINTVSMNITNDIVSGGEITIFAGDIILSADITAGGTIGVTAAGPAVDPGALGNIDASARVVRLTAPSSETPPSGVIIAEDDITASDNIILAFSFGEVDVAIGAGDEIEFNGASINSDNVTDADLEASLTTGSLLLAGLTAGVTNTFSINPATALIGLETLAFVDVGLFEEELTLYGQIGNGIGLALAQCEEQEGCAPNVTEDELNTLISTIEARIVELQRRLVDEVNEGERKELEELIKGFDQELQNFLDYRQQLIEFLAAGEEEEMEEDFEDEEGFDEDLDSLLEESEVTETEVDEVTRLAKVLETIKARIEWLESLKANTEERVRLSEITGIELTQETLDEIIESAESEAAYIENQIRLQIEGNEATNVMPSLYISKVEKPTTRSLNDF